MTGGFELPNLSELMRQAQALGAPPSAAAQHGEIGFVGSAAGGVVTVTLTGGAHTPSGIACSAVHVDPSAIDPDDPSLIEDLISAAINHALDQAEVEDAGGGGLAGMLSGLSVLGADLPGLLAGGLPGLGASLPDLLTGAMEALGLSATPPSPPAAGEPPTPVPTPTAPPKASEPPTPSQHPG